MEPQRGKGLLILIIVLIIAVFGLGGFVIYDKLLSNNSTKDNCPKCKECEKCEVCEQCNAPTANLYSIFANKLVSGRGQKIARIDNVTINEKLGIDSLQITASGDAYLSLSSTLASKYGASYKVLTNVLSAYVLEFGQGGFRTVIFVKENGTLTAIDANKLINDKTISLITNFGSVKDVVDIIQTATNYSMTVTAIDINGNTYSLDSYLK